MPIHLDPIPLELQRKVESVYNDRVADECRAFWEALEAEATTLSAADRTLIVEAMAFHLAPCYGHEFPYRFYAAHPMRVARFMAQAVSAGGPRYVESVVLALVHNAIEKGIASVDDLRARFGDWVAEAVRDLTQDRAAMQTPEGREAHYGLLARQDREVQIVKVLDKFDNVLAICIAEDAEVRARYLAEIREFVFPMCARVLPELSKTFEAAANEAEARGFYRG